jgi:tetratricopeptide (TPR) repeat protein
MRHFNSKLFLVLVFGTALLVALLFGINWLQTGRIARAMLSQADRAEQQGKNDQVIRYLSRYLELERDDVDTRARLGQALSDEKVAVNPKARTRALFVLEQVLAKQPERRDLRLRLVRLALDLDRRDLAREHLAVLTQERKDDGEAEYLFGQLLENEKPPQWDKAVTWYRQAVQHAPQQIEAYVRLADILRRQLPPEQQVANATEADKVMASLVANNEASWRAHLERWHYLKERSDLKEAANLQAAAVNVCRALELAPTNIEVLLAASDLAQAQDAPDKAREHLRRARDIDAKDMRIYREQAWLELREKNPELVKQKRAAAVAVLREGAAALKGDGRIELLWMLGNVLIDAGQTTEAAAVIADLRKTTATPATTDYLQARIHVLDGRWAEAVTLLERSRELLETSPDVARQADILMAQCYDKLNNPEARLAAYHRLVSREPNSVSGLLGKAAAHVAIGQFDDALVIYQQVLRLPNAPSAVWLDIARLVVFRNVQSATPDWKQAEEAITQAAQRNPDAIEIPLLRAEMLMTQSRQSKTTAAKAQAKLQEAQQLLQAACGKDPTRIELWSARAALAEIQNQPDEAVRILDEAEKAVSDPAKVRSAKIQLWARRGGDAAKTAFGKLALNVEQYPSADQAQIWSDLADAHYRLGNVAEAEALWNRLLRLPENQNNLRLRLLLAEAALQTGKEAVLRQLVEELQRIEGQSGVYWRYCQAVQLIGKARQAQNKVGLQEAQVLLEGVIRQRSAWAPAWIARADLDDLLGNSDQAIDNCRKAIELGERDPRLVRRIVDQLYKRQRFDEAEQEIRRLQKQAPSADLTRMMVDLVLRRQDYAGAASQAIDAVPPDSSDYRDHLWLGQVLAAGGQKPEQAEKHLRRAVELGGDKPEAWLVLVHFLVQSKKKQEAEAAIAPLERLKPNENIFLALSLCYEALGQPDKAQQTYENGLQAYSDSPLMVRNAAGLFLRRGNVAQAEPLLRKMAEGKIQVTPGEQGWARRSLALALAAQGDRRFSDALALVGLKVEAGKVVEVASHSTDDATEETRARVRVLFRQSNRENRLKAIALLEGLDKRQKLAADDQFILAQFYEAQGDWPKARDLLRQATVRSKNALYLNYFAQALVRQKDLTGGEADRCVRELAKLEKASKVEEGAFGSIDLQAQLAETQGQSDKAIALLRDYAARPGANPDRIFLVISALARQQRFSEALALCEQARLSAPEEQAQAMADKAAGMTALLLQASHAKEDQCARAAEWIRAQSAKNPKSTLLLLQLAQIEDLRGRYGEVEKLYRQVLTLDGRNVVAMNNLAWLLAQQKPKQCAEALELINRAIELLGPQPDLLDTRASVYLALGKNDLAIVDLELANADRPLPMRYFHLAQAHRAANNNKTAADLLKKATGAGLKAEHLHPAERVAFIKLLSEMDQR